MKAITSRVNKEAFGAEKRYYMKKNKKQKQNKTKKSNELMG